MKALRPSLLALAAILAAAPASAENLTAWRLFVADREAPKVTVVDLMNRSTLDTYELKGPAVLHRTDSGRSVFAVQGEQGTISAISTGIEFDDHGDHGDIHVEAPKLLDAAIDGTKPAHFVERQGRIAFFFDGEDAARVATETGILEGKPEFRTASVGKPHHGVAVPFGHFTVVTEPNPEDATKRPIGAHVLNGAGEPAGEVQACPGLHGSAGSGNLYALACQTGLLVMKAGRSGAPEITHLPYSASLPEGSSSTLIGGKGLQYFIGNYGPDRIVLVDPVAEGDEAFRLVELPTRRVHFAVDPIRPNFAYVITEDGQLHQVDVAAGTIAKSLKLTGAYSMDGHWNDPRPRIAVAGDQIVVTDPAEAKLQLVDAASFEKAGEIAMDGKPFNIVAVGGSGESHEGDEGHEGAHAHD